MVIAEERAKVVAVASRHWKEQIQREGVAMSDAGIDPRLAHNFIGASPTHSEAMHLICRFAPLQMPVLIVGETGTGKELAAHGIHYLSKRRAGAFIPVNCGSLPESLIESELFGHARGAFTDASRARNGLVRQAEGGSLFLDEIEALSLRGQVILLRFLQDLSFRSVGDDQTRSADVRIVAASNVNLRELVSRGEFREDLLFRLDVLSLTLPPLRDRISDLRLLIPHFLEKAAKSVGGVRLEVSQAALELLARHDWPGNLRELEHVLLRAHLMCAKPPIGPDDILQASPALKRVQSCHSPSAWSSLREEKLHAAVEVERRFVERALAQTSGNISAAARLCGIERASFSRMVKRKRLAATS
jgi:two-component system, NtrC family, response regulator GlrR